MIWVGVRSFKASVDDGICMNRFAINMEGRGCRRWVYDIR